MAIDFAGHRYNSAAATTQPVMAVVITPNTQTKVTTVFEDTAHLWIMISLRRI